MCKDKQLIIRLLPKKPEITFYSVSNEEVKASIDSYFMKLKRSLVDSEYFYTTEWGIREAVTYVREVYPFPKYVPEVMDCDDFAMLMKALVASEFGINDFWIVFGDSPEGYHAFNMARVEDRYVIIEPQLGTVFEVYENGYVPRECYL